MTLVNKSDSDSSQDELEYEVAQDSSAESDEESDENQAQLDEDDSDDSADDDDFKLDEDGDEDDESDGGENDENADSEEDEDDDDSEEDDDDDEQSDESLEDGVSIVDKTNEKSQNTLNKKELLKSAKSKPFTTEERKESAKKNQKETSVKVKKEKDSSKTDSSSTVPFKTVYVFFPSGPQIDFEPFLKGCCRNVVQVRRSPTSMARCCFVDFRSIEDCRGAIRALRQIKMNEKQVCAKLARDNSDECLEKEAKYEERNANGSTDHPKTRLTNIIKVLNIPSGTQTVEIMQHFPQAVEFKLCDKDGDPNKTKSALVTFPNPDLARKARTRSVIISGKKLFMTYHLSDESKDNEGKMNANNAKNTKRKANSDNYKPFLKKQKFQNISPFSRALYRRMDQPKEKISFDQKNQTLKREKELHPPNKSFVKRKETDVLEKQLAGKMKSEKIKSENNRVQREQKSANSPTVQPKKNKVKDNSTNFNKKMKLSDAKKQPSEVIENVAPKMKMKTDKKIKNATEKAVSKKGIMLKKKKGSS